MKKDSPIVLYSTEEGNVVVPVRFEDEDFWLAQKAIAELFETERSVIAKHLINIYSEGELDKDATCANMHKFKLKAAAK